MSETDSRVGAAHVPHTPAETAALNALYEHVGIRSKPGCDLCIVGAEGCEEGARLRLAVRDATQARTGAGARR